MGGRKKGRGREKQGIQREKGEGEGGKKGETEEGGRGKGEERRREKGGNSWRRLWRERRNRERGIERGSGTRRSGGREK